MREIVATTRITIPLGRQGENAATVVKFPVGGWDELYGAGAFELINVRPSENTPYTCSITVDDDFVYWIVQAADVALVGHGKCELTYVVDSAVAKSLEFATCVMASIEGGGTVPPPYESRIADLIERSAEITIDTERAEDAADAAERFAGNASSSADDAAGSARDAAASAEQVAGYANDSEAYAKGTRNGEDVGSSDPAYHNNSKYFSEQAGTAAGNAETSETNALSHQHTAERYAKGTEDGAAVPSGVGYHDNAKYYKEQADADALKAEGYAVGKQNGSSVGSQSPYYHNNAEYFAGQAAASAEEAEQAAATFEVDTTLSVSGKAADAKVTGDRFTDLSSQIEQMIIISGSEPSAEYNKIWINSNTDSVQVPTMNDYNALLDSIPVATTESAEVAVITDGASNLPIKSLTVGSGATKVTRIGKNIVPPLTEDITRYGVKFSANPDGSIHAQGTVTTATWISFSLASKVSLASLKLAIGDTLAISTTNGNCGVTFYDSENTRLSFKNVTSAGSVTVVIPENTAKIDINVAAETTSSTIGTVINEDIYFQIEIANAATDWERYYFKEYTLIDGVPNEPITTVRGYNRLWADTGNISVTYRQDLGILINNLS